MPECHGISEAWQHIDVRVGWYPARTKYSVAIRSKPNGGHILKRLPRHAGVGIQSARNPTGSSTPPRREPVAGCVWVCSRAGTVTGWVETAALEPDPDAAAKPPLAGPAGYDFEVGRTHPLPKKPNSCGKVSQTRPLRVVEADTVYLRYSGRGTAKHILHKGDVVRLLIVDSNSGFAFGEVVSAGPGASVRKGTRGWVWQGALRPQR